MFKKIPFLGFVPAALFSVLLVSSCSTNTTDPDLAESEGLAASSSSEKGDATIQATSQIGADDVVMVFDPATGKISPTNVGLDLDQRAVVVVLGNGKPFIKRIDQATPLLAGAPARFAPLNGYDHNDDGFEDQVLFFKARNMLPPNDLNRFIIDIDGLGPNSLWNYAAVTPWPDTYWPTVVALRRGDAIVAVDLETRVFAPSIIELREGQRLSMIVYNGPGTLDQDALRSTTLCLAPDSHVGFYDKENRAAGTRLISGHYLSLDGKDKNPTYVFHYEADEIRGPAVSAWTLEVRVNRYSFVAKYQPTYLKGGPGVRIDFNQ